MWRTSVALFLGFAAALWPQQDPQNSGALANRPAPESRVALLERELASQEQELGPTNSALFVTLKKLHDLHISLSQYQPARQAIERALHIAESSSPGSEKQIAQALNDLGVVLFYMGDFNGAMARLRRALAAWVKITGPGSMEAANAMRSICVLMINTGDYRGARSFCGRALEITGKKLGPGHSQTLGLVMNLGIVATSLKNYPEAVRYQKRVVAARRRSLSPDDPAMGRALVNLGEAQEGLQNYTAARANYLEARSIFDKQGAAQRRAFAYATRNLGDVSAKTGNYEEAIQWFRNSVDVMRSLVGSAHPTIGEHMANLASALRRNGARVEARRTAVEATRIRREHLRALAQGGSERQTLLFDGALAAGLHVLLALAGDPRSSAAERRDAWESLIRDRALVLDETAAKNRSFRAHPGTAVANLLKQHAAARGELARLVVKNTGGDPARQEADLERARDHAESIERLLAAASTEFRRAAETARAGFADVAAALAPGTVLVAYVRYVPQQFAIASPSMRGAEVEPRYLAFILSGGADTPDAVTLGPAREIDALVSAWRGEIRREAESGGRSAIRNEASYRTVGAALRRAVWDPLRTHLASATRIFVVPDGAIQFVNISALPDETSGYLVERPETIHYLSTERDLVSRPTQTSAVGLLAVGNPSFDASQPRILSNAQPRFRGAPSDCLQLDSITFPPLPGSAREVSSVIGIWKGQDEPVTFLSGEQATEAAVKGNAPGHRVLHIATHGFFLEDHCGANSVERENPLLRAGLALSGANQRKGAAPGQEDGILTAEEVATLDLEGAEWVVLSGCETGIGDIKHGEGVLGLRRAFQVAGARTLITSLWPVEDDAARQWMVALYQERFGRGSGTAESVRRASVSQLLARRRTALSTHPFYWAGFVAAGDWR